MKKTLIILLSLISTLSFGSTIKWSAPIESGKRTPAPIVIGQDDNNIYLLRYSGIKKIFIDSYRTDNLSVKKTREFLPTYSGKKLSLLSAQMINNKPVVITGFYNKKTKVTYFFIHLIKANLTVDKPILLGSMPKIKLFTVASEGGQSTFKLRISEDGTIAFALFPQNTANSPTKLNHSILIDGDLVKQFNSKIKLPFLPENFKTLNTQLGNDGIYYILGYNLVKGKKKGLLGKQEVFRDNIYLYAIDTETGEINQTKILIEDDVEQMSMKVSPNGTIAVMTLIRTSTKGVSGAICIIFDNELNETNRTKTPFEESFITTTYTEKQQKKLDNKKKKANVKGKEAPKAKFYNYIIDHIVEAEDGSFTVLAEQHYVIVKSSTRTSPNGTTTTTTSYHYYYNDIIAVNYDRDGRFKWKNVIEKRQHSVNDFGFYSSYFPVKDGDDIGIIYNSTELNNIENVDNLSRNQKKKASRRTVCMNVTLSSDGEMNSEELFAFDEEEKLKIAPKYSSQSKKGDIVIFAKSKKGRKIGVIKL